MGRDLRSTCRNFVPESLALAAGRAGLAVTDLGRSFAEQYLWITARPGADDPAPLPPELVELGVQRAVSFGRACRSALDRAGDQLQHASASGPVAVWGAGSKGVSYLNLVDGASEILGIVDLNPRKSGTFVPGTGHRITGPDELTAWRPATVLVANPIYFEEIRGQVQELVPGARTEVLAT